ncbi:MAG: hypothetical protein ABW024_08305 [Microbacterium sp.]
METHNGSPDIVWARVDDGFYVGSIPGRFLGCIDRQAGGEFLALDVHTQPIGRYPTLDQAMSAVQDSSLERDDA